MPHRNVHALINRMAGDSNPMRRFLLEASIANGKENATKIKNNKKGTLKFPPKSGMHNIDAPIIPTINI